MREKIEDTEANKREGWNEGHYSREGRTSQPEGQGRAAWRPWSSSDRAKDSFQGVRNWSHEKGNMLVHTVTQNLQPAKWFQISGSL